MAQEAGLLALQAGLYCLLWCSHKVTGLHFTYYSVYGFVFITKMFILLVDQSSTHWQYCCIENF